MTLTERTIRDRLDGKISRLPNGFWNYNTLSLAIKIIIEEKFGIKPEDISVENMKNPISIRLMKEYCSVASTIQHKYGTRLRDMIMKTYNITPDNWYLYNNIETLYELKIQRYALPKGLSYYEKRELLFCKLFLYGLARENKVLTRTNILEVSRKVFTKFGWFKFEPSIDADSYFFKCDRHAKPITLSEVLITCFSHSFQAQDFTSSFADIKYVLNYEVHVRLEMTYSKLLSLVSFSDWYYGTNLKVQNLIVRYYNNNAGKNINDFKNLIEWEGPLYDKLMKELEYVKTHKVPFGYKDGDISEFKINL